MTHRDLVSGWVTGAPLKGALVLKGSTYSAIRGGVNPEGSDSS